MCRLLAVEGSPNHTFELSIYLPEFAEKCQSQNAPDGSLQEDGWGITFTVDDFEHALDFWRDVERLIACDKDITNFDYTQDSTGFWRILYTSLLPIWQSVKRLPYQDFPMAQRMMVHARAASVPTTKDQLQFNQPHLSEKIGFAFNGSLVNANMREFQNMYVRAGRFDRRAVPTQKLMTLLEILYEQRTDVDFPMVVALQELNRLLTEKFSQVNGMNIIATTSEGMYALCGTHQADLRDYYTLFAGQDMYCSQLSAVSSFPMDSLKLKSMKVGQVFQSEQNSRIRTIHPAVV